VASLDTSMCDETGNPRKDFGLAEVLGVHFRGAAGSAPSGQEKLDVNFLNGVDAAYWSKRKNIFNFQRSSHPVTTHPLLDQYLDKQEFIFKGPAGVVDPFDNASATVGTIKAPENKEHPVPAIIAREFGCGKVAFFPAALDSGYYLYPY